MELQILLELSQPTGARSRIGEQAVVAVHGRPTSTSGIIGGRAVVTSTTPQA